MVTAGGPSRSMVKTRIGGMVEGLPTFVLAVFAVLAMPGPTNTLLATAGATGGWARSLILLPAELSAYLISITTISAVAAPLFAHSPVAASALKLACGLYLAYVAWSLWHFKAKPHLSAVGCRRVFLTTLLNPKGLVFAVAIFPHWGHGALNFVFPYLTTFAILGPGIGCCWIAVGSVLRARTAEYLSGTVLLRAGSVVMGCFALVLLVSVVTVS